MTSFKPEEKEKFKESLKEKLKNHNFILENSELAHLWKFRYVYNNVNEENN